MKLESFDAIWQRAAERKGGEKVLSLLMPDTTSYLDKLTDAQLLSAMSEQIFKSGFVWKVVENKWPYFEQQFWGFDPEKLLMMSPDQQDKRLSDAGLIRHGKKIQSIFDNAQFVLDIAAEHGSFGKWIRDWPSDDIVSLWLELKKRGSRLGGNTGPYFLRFVGKDSFILASDTVAYLKAHQVLDASPTSKRGLMQVQAAFNQWQQESGLSFAEVSRVVAMSTGDNRLGVD